MINKTKRTMRKLKQLAMLMLPKIAARGQAQFVAAMVTNFETGPPQMAPHFKAKSKNIPVFANAPHNLSFGLLAGGTARVFS